MGLRESDTNECLTCTHTHRGVEGVEAISRLFFQDVEGDWKGDT